MRPCVGPRPWVLRHPAAVAAVQLLLYPNIHTEQRAINVQPRANPYPARFGSYRCQVLIATCCFRSDDGAANVRSGREQSVGRVGRVTEWRTSRRQSGPPSSGDSRTGGRGPWAAGIAASQMHVVDMGQLFRHSRVDRAPHAIEKRTSVTLPPCLPIAATLCADGCKRGGATWRSIVDERG